MSGYQPANGDRVRVVIEGEAAKVQPLGFNVRGGSGTSSWVEAAHVVSVEKVEPPTPPLPTTPGSVIARRGTYPRRVLVHDVWVCVSHDYGCGCDVPASESHRLRDYVVLFDAGAES